MIQVCFIWQYCTTQNLLRTWLMGPKISAINRSSSCTKGVTDFTVLIKILFIVAKCQNIKDLSFLYFWHLATLHFIEVSFIVTTCSNSWPWWLSDHLYNLLHNMSSFCAHFVVFSYIENILHFYKIHVFRATPSLEKYISPSCSHLICWGQGMVYHQP